MAHARNVRPSLPSLADAHLSLGDLLKRQGEVEEAAEHYAQAVRQQPDCVDAHYHLGSVLTDLGRFDEAVAHLENALRLDPDYAAAYQVLGQLATDDQYQFSPEQLRRIDELVAGDKLSSSYACALQFTLGGVFDKLGNFDAAFRYYQRANATQLGILREADAAFDAEEFRQTVDAIITVFDKSVVQRIQGLGLEDETPIFVVGMPRSGTTLVEQIIASHSQAAGVGELQDIARLALEMPGLVKGDEDYPQCVVRADAGATQALAQRYLSGLRQRGGHHVARIVDKTPANFLFLGFITALCPQARVIHCLREPLDICLSCYLNSFNAVTWASRLEDIGIFYCGYRRVMEHWRRVQPLRMCEVSYEQLVRNPEKTSRKMIEFCGLDWSDQCLEFHRHGGPVQTSSRVQVRQPIYETSIGRWKNYEKQLKPLEQLLADSLR